MSGPSSRLPILGQTPQPDRVAVEEPVLLQEAELDDVTYRSLMRDLAELADVQEVRVKAGAELEAAARSYTLEEGRVTLEQGEAHGLQVIYRFEDAMWCDTFLRSQDGVHLLRMRAGTELGSAPSRGVDGPVASEHDHPRSEPAA